MNKFNIKRAGLLSFLLLAVLLVSVSVSTAQEGDGLTDVPDSIIPGAVMFGESEKTTDAPATSFSVEMASKGDPSELKAVSVIVTFDSAADVDVAKLEATSGGQVIHNFTKLFNGVSMVVPAANIDSIAGANEVTGVYLDQLQQLDTENSPAFIGADHLWSQLGGQQSAGEGTTIGILDSGIWPEHPSVSDPDPYGKPYAAPPVVPGSNGFGAGGPRDTCDFGNTAYNPDDAPFTCNNKLIGAYDFTDTYKLVYGLLPDEFDSARDANGHGTHTLTTAGGNRGVSASMLGANYGTVSGIAPRAHVIAYKVCGEEGCFGSDSAAAVEQAILDDVDAINFSISGGGDPYNDIVEQMFAIAYDNGVFVSASAGNSGPGPDTVAHRGPWTMTVAASTQNRTFEGEFTMSDGVQADLTVSGVTITSGYTATVVDAADYGDAGCLSPFTPGTFNGEIVLCQRGAIARVAKGYNVLQGGAGGMVLYNPVLQGLSSDSHWLPALHVENDAGDAILDFMANATGTVTGVLSGVNTVPGQGDKMAAFSSRGGPAQTLGISKPDVTAPGVEILAGQTPFPAFVPDVPAVPGQLFQAISGTSMSSPHVAGSGALLKDLHPDWTPGQIKSALMMTALTNVVKEDGVTPADPFDYGSGRIDLSAAGNPYLTISDSTASFIALEDELWNANYPSLYVPVMPGKITVERTLQNDSRYTKWWSTRVHAPSDLDIDVKDWIRLPRNGSKTIEISVDASQVPMGETRHAEIEFRGPHYTTLTFPITIVRRQADVSFEQECDPTIIFRHHTTECTITMTNNSFDDATVDVDNRLPKQLRIVNGSVVGADQNGGRKLSFDGTLFGAAPPIVNVAEDPLASAFGYYPLSLFGSTTDIGATDESIANYNIPSFTYAGESYSQIGIVSNGYVVVGGGTGADVDYINSDLPEASIPNNILAPFWTDLNPDFGGRVLINVLSAGGDTWTVVEWESVSNFGDGETNTFQIWIGSNTDANPGEDISFVYGADVSDGDGGFLTVGAENKFGNTGGTVYFDGLGTPPSPSAVTGYEVDVFSTPGTPGETHTITYTAKWRTWGEWENCAQMTSDLFQGTSTACVNGDSQ